MYLNAYLRGTYNSIALSCLTFEPPSSHDEVNQYTQNPLLILMCPCREYDCPFALLYTTESEASGDSKSTFRLQGSIGEFTNNSTIPDVLKLNETGGDRLIRNLSSAVTTEDPVLLTTDDGLPDSWSMAARKRGWGDACTEAVVLPLQSNRYHKVRALLVLGVSTRSHYDAAYKNWNEELRRTIGSTIHSLRRKEIAALELAQREKKANTISRKYSHLVKVMELSDVGIFSCDTEGALLEANESWYRLSCVPRQNESVTAFEWLESVYDEDREMVMSHWHSMLKGKPVTVCQVRVRNSYQKLTFFQYQMRWKHPDRPEGRWILAVCLPVMDEHGKIISIGKLFRVTLRSRTRLTLSQLGAQLTLMLKRGWRKMLSKPCRPLNEQVPASKDFFALLQALQ